MKKEYKRAKAFIFDMNGTMIDDMPFHQKAWFDLLNGPLHHPISWDDVKKEMYGTNVSLLERVFGEGYFSRDEMDRLSLEKEKIYQKAFLPQLKLISGLESFLQKTRDAGIPMGIGTAAIPFNVDYVLDNLNIRSYFSAIVDADSVQKSKPDPQVFQLCAERLGIAPEDCLVFEDAPKGVEAALNASMKAVGLTTYSSEIEFSELDNVLFFIRDYQDKQLAGLF